MKLCYHCMTRIENTHTHICPNCKKDTREERVAHKYLQPGTVLGGRFIVGHPLGVGGFGNTYIGWNDVLLRKVAIKEFYPEQYARRAEDGLNVTVKDPSQAARYQNGLRRFMDEARSVAALQDIKGVVAISNFFEENGTGYIIMEYLEGMDVLEILKRSGNKKDYEWCRRVILTVLHTLREIHKRGVLHRDIAPDNIFVTNEGVIKLIDFGAAKHSDEIEQKNAEIMLKVGYAPIEQYSRRTMQGAYTDIYALAAVFYRMLTGQKPIPANQRLKDDTLITPSEMGVSLPQQAEMAIMVSLNVNPQYRLQSADEFMEALDGKSFVPVYEPEWILPPIAEKKGFSSLPFAAKISIAFLILCIVSGGIGAVSYFIYKDMHSTEQLSARNSVVLEDYSGQDVAEAVTYLEEELGITENVSIVYKFSESAEDRVISQDPQPGTIEKDTKITLYVSGAEKIYTIQDFVGKSQEEIIEWYSRYNFEVYSNESTGSVLKVIETEKNEEFAKQKGKIALEFVYSDDVKKGMCISQSVPSGVTCAGTDDIVFSISAGKLSDYEIEIPNLVGLQREEAEKALEESGVMDYLKIIYLNTDGKVNYEGDGKVVEQSSDADAIYNSFENKIYQYNNGKRTNIKQSNLLQIVIEEPPKPQPQPQPEPQQPVPQPQPQPEVSAPNPQPAPEPPVNSDPEPGSQADFEANYDWEDDPYWEDDLLWGEIEF